MAAKTNYIVVGKTKSRAFWHVLLVAKNGKARLNSQRYLRKESAYDLASFLHRNTGFPIREQD